MSNKRINLRETSCFDFIDDGLPIEAFSEYDTLVWCDFGDMYYLPMFVTRCMLGGIKPICGMSFRLKTPEDCLTDSLLINCFAQDEEGCAELQFLYSRSDVNEINYEDFYKFSNHLQVGLDIALDEVDMIAIENILETVLIPDFVIIDSNQDMFRSWKRCQKILESKNILICGGSYTMNKNIDDSQILEDFNFLGDKAYEYVIENPQKICDKISGNYNFDISLIERIEQSRNEFYQRYRSY